MSNLVKVNYELSPVYRALSSPCVIAVDPHKLFEVLNGAIAKSYIDAGFKGPADSDLDRQLYSNMVNELVIYVRHRFPEFHLNEIPLAIERGTVGEYGDYMGLNKKSFVMFLNAYIKSEERKTEVNNFIILQQPMSSTEPTPAERFNTGKQLVLEGYTAFIAGSPIERTLTINYDFLYKLGLITYTPAEKQEIYNQAIPAVLAARAETKQRQNGIRDLIKNFNLTPDKGTPHHAEIVSKAKGLTCLKYFGECMVSSGPHLDWLIDSKKDLFLTLNK